MYAHSAVAMPDWRFYTREILFIINFYILVAGHRPYYNYSMIVSHRDTPSNLDVLTADIQLYDNSSV